MAQIPLSRGLFALVDDDDVDRLSTHKWFAGLRADGNFDARRNIPIGGGKRTILLMHRLLRLGMEKGGEVDHWNGNSLDNRKSNLRLTDDTGNARNCRKRKDNSSGIKGVDVHKGKWRARIAVNGKSIHLGYFSTFELAEIAYDEAALKFHGEFSSPNRAIINRGPEHFLSDWGTRQVID